MSETLPATAQTPDLVKFGDFMVVDQETGDIVGLIGDTYDEIDGVLVRRPETAAPFIVQDLSGCEWVLSKFAFAEADLAAVDGHPDVIAARAIVANAEALKKERKRRLEYLHARFSADLAEFAKTQFKGNSKTFKTVHGSISLRHVAGDVRMEDPEAAVQWAEYHNPDAVKREFRISALTDDEKAHIREMLSEGKADPTTAKAFRLDPDRESVTIKTGVGGAK